MCMSHDGSMRRSLRARYRHIAQPAWVSARPTLVQTRASFAGRADKVMVRLPAGPSLEARLRAAVPELLPALAGRGGPGAKGEAAPSGSPAALLVSPSAVYAQELRRQLRGLSPVPARCPPSRALRRSVSLGQAMPQLAAACPQVLCPSQCEGLSEGSIC
jgi:hypothetical protein